MILLYAESRRVRKAVSPATIVLGMNQGAF